MSFPGAYCYATTNLLTGLAATAFTWSAGLGGATRSRLNDGRMDSVYVNGNVAATINLVINFGAPVALTGFGVMNCNAASAAGGATLTIESADDAGISINNVVRKAATTLNAVAPKQKDHVLQFAAGVARQYWRLTWNVAAAVTNFQVGELWAFSGQTQFVRRAIYGDGEARSFKTAELEFYNGNTRAYYLGGPIRSVTLPFSDLTSTQLEAIYALIASARGGASPFLWMNSYEAVGTAAATTEQEVIYGRIGSPDFSFTVPDYQLFQPGDLVIKSLGREIGA